jgi:hypothetical protein
MRTIFKMNQKLSEDDILRHQEAFSKAEETTSSKVENSIPLGKVLADNIYLHIRVHRKNNQLLYQIFRGSEVPNRFWGTGEFGLCVLGASEDSWPMDEPKISYEKEVVRPEAYADSLKKISQYPSHYFGSYLVIISNIDTKPILTDERVKRFAVVLNERLAIAISSWKDN